MKMSITLDGMVADLTGRNEWMFKSSDEESLAWSVEKTKEAGLIIMGTKTFQITSSYWPTAPGPFSGPMNTIPKAVFTQKGLTDFSKPGEADLTAAEASWAAARIFTGDLAQGIKTLKAEPGNPILAIGGAGFMRSLIATGLIDEYLLITHPIILGSGLPVFPDLTSPIDLKLADVRTFKKGVSVRTYQSV